jgi:hypothetical protein
MIQAIYTSEFSLQFGRVLYSAQLIYTDRFHICNQPFVVISKGFNPRIHHICVLVLYNYEWPITSSIKLKPVCPVQTSKLRTVTVVVKRPRPLVLCCHIITTSITGSFNPHYTEKHVLPPPPRLVCFDHSNASELYVITFACAVTGRCTVVSCTYTCIPNLRLESAI